MAADTTPAGISLDPDRLRFAMATRGLDGRELAHRACLAPGTITSARRGKAVSPRAARAIARAIASTPVVPELVDLVAEPGHETAAVVPATAAVEDGRIRQPPPPE
ncbi:MAG: hypothetical protein ACRENX_09660 [Candidatus Dormibacteria bacterium]